MTPDGGPKFPGRRMMNGRFLPGPSTLSDPLQTVFFNPESLSASGTDGVPDTLIRVVLGFVAVLDERSAVRLSARKQQATLTESGRP